MNEQQQHAPQIAGGLGGDVLKEGVKDKARPDYFNADWFAVLLTEVAATSVKHVAEKMGVSRSTLSLFVNGSGLYGAGKAKPDSMEVRFRQAFEKLTCPHTHKQVGIEHCREVALCRSPNHNPMKLMQWQACQQCQYKPHPIATPVEVKPIKTTDVQQAGVIDTVTRPLPEVGAPQVDLAALQGETA
jgi:hypothetical protein